MKYYNTIEFDLTEDSIIYTGGRFNEKIMLNEIKEALYQYNVGLPRSIRIYTKKKSIIIPSTLLNYKELEDKISSVKSINKKAGIIYFILHNAIPYFVFAIFEASLFLNSNLFILITSILFLGVTIFKFWSYAFGTVRLYTKIILCLAYAIGTLASLFCMFDSAINIYERQDKFKDNDGKIYLYQLDCEYRYDKNGNEIYFKDIADCYIKQYDDENRLSHFLSKGEDTYQYWIEYDSNGNKVKIKYDDGQEYNYEYDEKGRKVHSALMDSDGNTIIRECYIVYDDIANIETEIYNDGEKVVSQKDANGNVLFMTETYPDSDEVYTEANLYDEHGNRIHRLDNDGYELWCEFNEEDKLVYSKSKTIDADGNEKFFIHEYEYDENGNEIYSSIWSESEKKFEQEEYSEYDSYNNLTKKIYSNEDTTYVMLFKYKYNGQGKVLKRWSRSQYMEE